MAISKCTRRLLTPFGVGTLLLCASGAVARAQGPDYNNLARAAEEELRESKTPGAAVAVISGDRVVFLKGFGLTSTEAGEPVTPDTLFLVGSCAKVFTAARVVALKEEGKLKLSEPVGTYVPGLLPSLSRVTPHQLLTHTAGIADEVTDYGPLGDAALEAYVRSWGDGFVIAEPGEVFSYSNPGYDALGLVIEKVGGGPFARQMDDWLSKQLRMRSTTFQPTVAMTYPLAKGHVQGASGVPTVVRPMPSNAAQTPDGFLFSSGADLSRFVAAFLNRGALDGRQLLTPSLVAEMAEPRVSIPNSDVRFGYGLTAREVRGVRVLESSGAVRGFSCLMRMAPEQRFAVVVLANGGRALRKTADRAMELALPLKPQTGATATAPARLSAAEASRLVGRYVNGALSIELVAKGDALFLKAQGFEVPVSKAGENRYSVSIPLLPDPIEFTTVAGADGSTKFLVSRLRALRRAAN